MSNSISRFTLDIQKSQSQISIPVRFCDTARELHISLSDGGKPFVINDGCLVNFSARKPDGNKLYNECKIESIEVTEAVYTNGCTEASHIHKSCPIVNNTTIIYEFTEQTTNCAGIVECEIEVIDVEARIIASPRFILVVDERVNTVSDIVSDEEKTLITNILLQEEERQEAEEKRVALMVYTVDENNNAFFEGEISSKNGKLATESELTEALGNVYTKDEVNTEIAKKSVIKVNGEVKTEWDATGIDISNSDNWDKVAVLKKNNGGIVGYAALNENNPQAHTFAVRNGNGEIFVNTLDTSNDNAAINKGYFTKLNNNNLVMPAYDVEAGVIKFSTVGGDSKTVDLPIEKIIKSVSLSEDGLSFVFTFHNSDPITLPVDRITLPVWVTDIANALSEDLLIPPNTEAVKNALNKKLDAVPFTAADVNKFVVVGADGSLQAVEIAPGGSY